MILNKNRRKKIVIFASGSGTNAENIIKYFQNDENVDISAVFSNVRGAKVLERAEKLQVKTYCFNRNSFYESDEILNLLKEIQPNLIVLAGFLWIFPQKILHQFPDKVVNIHPALLPKYGGKGMYGAKVHQAVVDGKETQTGISIHYVNKKYDEGELIFQATTPVLSKDSAEDVAQKIHLLEYEYYPKIIENLLFSEK